MNNGGVKLVKVSLNRPNLYYEIVRKPQGRKLAMERLIEAIRSLQGESAIVYCMKRDETEQVAEDLRFAGISAEFYHAGMESERDERQAQFMSGETQVIVATIAFGMGIDKEDVRMVAHWDLPKSIEAYYQETGRAGRDGKRAKCLLLYSPGAIGDQQYFARKHGDASVREHALSNIGRIAGICETSGCRRKMMLAYFDEHLDGDCGACDNCNAHWVEEDVTPIWRALATTVVQTHERFGSAYIVALMRGGRTQRAKDNRHNELPTFGALNHLKPQYLNEVVDLLLETDLLERDDEYRIVRLTQRGRQVLRAEDTVAIRRRADEPTTSATPPRPVRRSANSGGGGRCDPRLFEALRQLRWTISQDAGVPAFVIFPDSTLELIAEAKPTTRAELSRISGVGPAKLEQYGKQFMAAVAAYVAESGRIPTAAEPPAPDTSPSENPEGCPNLYRELEELLSRIQEGDDGTDKTSLPSSTLRLLTANLPFTRSQFEALPGVGASRSRDHADWVVAAIARHVPNCGRCTSVKKSMIAAATIGTGPDGNSEDASGLLRNVTDTIDQTSDGCDTFLIASILRGGNRDDAVTERYGESATFGVESDRAYQELKAMIGQLIDLGFFARQRGASGVLEVTELCRKVIDSGEPIWLPKLPA